jgi:hypothetical protein
LSKLKNELNPIGFNSSRKSILINCFFSLGIGRELEESKGNSLLLLESDAGDGAKFVEYLAEVILSGLN